MVISTCMSPMHSRPHGPTCLPKPICYTLRAERGCRPDAWCQHRPLGAAVCCAATAGLPRAHRHHLPQAAVWQRRRHRRKQHKRSRAPPSASTHGRIPPRRPSSAVRCAPRASGTDGSAASHTLLKHVPDLWLHVCCVLCPFVAAVASAGCRGSTWAAMLSTGVQ